VGRGAGSVNHRLDPAARDTDGSSLDNWHNKSQVVDASQAWSPFNTPSFDDLILYQCHVGSFSGFRDDHVALGGVASFDQLQTKLDYIRGLGFNALALLPVQEFRFDRSWGYNPSFYFALESAYGRSADLRLLVDACHERGLAVIFNVVYNHISNEDSSCFHFDERADGPGDSYLGTDRSYGTEWGTAPAFWRQGIRDFFVANIEMYLREYNGDGLRFDSTRTMERARGLGNDGWEFMQHLTWEAKRLFPGKYLIAEDLPDHESILSSAGFHATWTVEPFYGIRRALNGDDPVGNIEELIGNSFGPGRTYAYSWNTVTYLMGSHDECGDDDGGRKGKRHFVALRRPAETGMHGPRRAWPGPSTWQSRAHRCCSWAASATSMTTGTMERMSTAITGSTGRSPATGWGWGRCCVR
jgi:1,4-alpha-glucan branching enzyme